ncbi:MAG: cobalamin B12-binding domain-containing protein [Planctomycetota bacterium]|jgi:methanogenic corrinoid protein MtbC1
MLKECTLERYLDKLLTGNRPACRAVIEETLQGGVPANAVYMEVIWPIMVEIDKLYKRHKIDSAQQAFASRINRTIVDQLQNKLPRRPQKDKKIAICSSADQQAELGGQMITDLFESDGWDARFLGGDVNNDDILAFIHSYHPDVLLLYGVQPKSAPEVRKLIDTVRVVNAWPDMKIMLSGGVFDRADGLWEEIGADLYAATAADAVRVASADEKDIPKPQRTIKRRKTPQKKVAETVAAN